VIAATAAGISTAGCVLTNTPLSPSARQPTVPRIGYLSAFDSVSSTTWTAALVHGLRERGYVEGETIQIEWRFADNATDRLPDLAAELVATGVRVLVTSSTPAVDVAARATSTVPIVATGPAALQVLVNRGLVSSAAQPLRNVTGNCCTPPLLAKRVELLHEAATRVNKIAYLENPAGSGGADSWLQFEAASHILGIEPVHLSAQTPSQLEVALDAALDAGANGLHVNADGLFAAATGYRVVHWALERQIASIYTVDQFAREGGLMAYAADIASMHRRAAAYVDDILKGADPARLPLDLAPQFDLTVNVRTAHALGIDLPQSVLVQATEILK
jgi:putative ABC transport system substrate-binding protein